MTSALIFAVLVLALIAVLGTGLWLLVWLLCRINAPRRHEEHHRRLMALLADPNTTSQELWHAHRRLL